MNWKTRAYWIQDHLPFMHFTLSTDCSTVATVWFDVADDRLGNEMMRTMSAVLRELFGAYLCGPMSNVALPGRSMHQSFGFWNQALLDNAARVFPLPEGFQPGPILFIGPQPRDWSRVERAYNKCLSELPQWR